MTDVNTQECLQHIPPTAFLSLRSYPLSLHTHTHTNINIESFFDLKMASKIVAFSPSPLLSNKLSRPSGKSIGPCSVIFPTSGLKPTLAVRAQSNGDYADGTSLDVRVNNTAAVDRRQQPRRWALDASRSGKCSVDEQKWTEEGLIIESMPDGKFQVKLDNGATILGYLSGKLRQRFIRVIPGDRVKLEVSRYDLSKGRITYRLRNKDRVPDKALEE